MGNNASIIVPRPRVDEATFKGVLIGSAVVSFCFLPYRAIARLKTFNRLFIDDVLVLFAWTLLLGYAVMWWVETNDFYTYLWVASGSQRPGPDFQAQFKRYAQTENATWVMTPLCLWSVKASFLVFFRQMVKGVRKHERVWLFVTIYVAATFFIWVGCGTWRCSTGTLQERAVKCSLTDKTATYVLGAMWAQMLTDITSDAAIAFIPIHLLWKVQINWRKKLLLMGLFSLTVFIITSSILRMAISLIYSKLTDETWLFVWTAIEMAVAIIVSCIASTPAVFTGTGGPTDSAGRYHQPRQGSFGQATTSFPGKHNSRSTMSSIVSLSFTNKSRWSNTPDTAVSEPEMALIVNEPYQKPRLSGNRGPRDPYEIEP